MLKGTLIHELLQLAAYWKRTLSSKEVSHQKSEKFSFGEHPSQYLMVYSPETVDSNKPIIVYYHGGGWIFGKPDLFIKKAALFTKLGFQVVMPCYRKVPRYRAEHILEDASLMLGKLKELKKQGKILQLDRIILGGVSAGANIVSLIYFQKALLQKAGFSQEQFSGLFLFAPPMDLAQMKSSLVLTRFAGNQKSERFYSASPINFIENAKPVPIHCVHGKLDGLVQYQASQTFRSKYEELYPGYLEYVSLEEASHLDAASWAHTCLLYTSPSPRDRG